MDIRKENEPTVLLLLLILEFSSVTNLGIILPFLFNVLRLHELMFPAFVRAIPFILMTHEVIRFLNWRGMVLECHSVHLWACRYAEHICHEAKWHDGKEESAEFADASQIKRTRELSQPAWLNIPDKRMLHVIPLVPSNVLSFEWVGVKYTHQIKERHLLMKADR